MRIQVLVLLGTAAASVMGAAVQAPRSNGYKPADLGDGIFTAYFGENELVNVTRIGDVNLEDTAEAADTSPAGLTRRGLPISRFGCYKASENQNNWQTARKQLKNLCNQNIRIPSQGIMYAVSGKHVAFGCSWGGDNPCNGGEYESFLSHINANCGSWRGGWVDMDVWKKQYGMQQWGEHICGMSDRVHW